MSGQNRFEAAFQLHLAGKHQDAEMAYRLILSDDPLHADARHYLGVLLHQLGQTPEGISLIMAALESDSGNAGHYNDLGNILVECGELASAAEAFRKSLNLNSDDANVWNNLGSVLHRLKDYDSAESAYRNALEQSAGFVPAMNNLAALLMETDRQEQASVFFCQAYVQPPLTGKPLKVLGYAYYRLGLIAKAAECYREWLNIEPANAFAKHHLAACTAKDIPVQASDDYLRTFFDDMSEHFDEKMTCILGYRGPEIVADLLEGYIAKDRTLDVLDGGCGTGLCAQVLAPYARHLTGVDLSRGMLIKAGERKVYDELVEMELIRYLQGKYDAFDLIAMADTLIYFGELAALFTAVRKALRTAGLFVFTVEAELLPVDFRLTPSGRYAHNRLYLSKMLDDQGFAILRCEDVILRNEFAIPTQGIGVLARILPQ